MRRLVVTYLLPWKYSFECCAAWQIALRHTSVKERHVLCCVDYDEAIKIVWLHGTHYSYQ